MDEKPQVFIGDANIFLRFLTKDVLSQALKIKKIFQEAERDKLKVIVFHVTVVEILFHLEHWYRFSKNEAVEKLISLLSPPWLEIEDKDALFFALENYKNTNIDFVDLLLWSLARKRRLSILSFDKDFDKLKPKLRSNP